MNDIQLYNYYLTIPLSTLRKHSWIYPKYIKIVGRSISVPHPHRYLNFEEFLDVIEDFKFELNSKFSTTL